MTTVLVVDDHALVRSGVRGELARVASDLQVVAEAADVEGAVAAITSLHPEVVLLDVHLPGGQGGG
ncbi:response regulator, partial [Buchananella hordeovulneris]